MNKKSDQMLKTIRKPSQTRSINKKEKILDSAYELFCQKGYYKTTTNEIAKRAQVSIGSLYSYFEDKDTIFFEILNRYHDDFQLTNIYNNQELFRQDYKKWLRELILILINRLEHTKELNRELKVLSYHNTKVATILEENRKKTMNATIGYYVQLINDLKVEDAEASITVMFDLISATVDRIVFRDNEIDSDRLISVTVDAVYYYFFTKE